MESRSLYHSLSLIRTSFFDICKEAQGLSLPEPDTYKIRLLISNWTHVSNSKLIGDFAETTSILYTNNGGVGIYYTCNIAVINPVVSVKHESSVASYVRIPSTH